MSAITTLEQPDLYCSATTLILQVRKDQDAYARGKGRVHPNTGLLVLSHVGRHESLSMSVPLVCVQ